MLNMQNKLSLSKQFKALGNLTRLQIYQVIWQESAFCDLEYTPIISKNTSKELIKLTKLAPATITEHLEKLKDAKLIYEIKKGRFKYLFPDKEVLAMLQNGLKFNQQLTKSNPIKIKDMQPIKENKLPELIDFLSLHEFRFLKPVFNEKKSIIKYYAKDRGFGLVYDLKAYTISLIDFNNNPDILNQLSGYVVSFSRIV